jgi:hypothetical protein
MSHKNLFKINTQKILRKSNSKSTFKQELNIRKIDKQSNSPNNYSKSLNLFISNKSKYTKASNSPNNTNNDEKIECCINQPKSPTIEKEQNKRYRSKALEFILNNRNDFKSSLNDLLK